MKYLKYFENNTNNRFDLTSPAWNDDCKEYQSFLDKNFPGYKEDSKWKDQSVYVSITSDKLLSVCEFQIYPDHIWISYIYTDVKQQGLSTSMIKYIIKCYPSVNKYKCYVRKSNIPSLNMFKKLGFEIIEEHDDSFYELELNL